MVDYFQALILAIVQGITEWLPISSSGHLALMQHLFGISPPLFFDIALHFGTLISVVVYFWRDILALIRQINMILFIIIASIPTAIIGLTMKDFFASFYSDISLVGGALLLTGIFLYLTRFAKQGKNLNPKLAFIIGIAQGLAVAPGISRAGSTIGAGILLGLEKEAAARFSFILSIPAIIGATVLEGKDLALSSIDVGPTILGIVVAAIVGYLSIDFLLNIIRKGDFSKFSYYCLALGTIIVILGVL
jgi:undecaprenyl-diphosphatase